MRPGVTYLPFASMTVAPCGTCTDARGPSAVIFPPLTTGVASEIGAPPLPSITVAPTIASMGAGVCLASSAEIEKRRVRTVAREAMRVSMAVNYRSFCDPWEVTAHGTEAQGRGQRRR